MENRYWNNTGAAQKHYDEMMEAGFKFTKAGENAFISYQRYYNDGDLPYWAKRDWSYTRLTPMGWKLTEAGEEELERRVTNRVETEYKRFLKTQKH